ERRVEAAVGAQLAPQDQGSDQRAFSVQRRILGGDVNSQAMRRPLSSVSNAPMLLPPARSPPRSSTFLGTLHVEPTRANAVFMNITSREPTALQSGARMGSHFKNASWPPNISETLTARSRGAMRVTNASHIFWPNLFLLGLPC